MAIENLKIVDKGVLSIVDPRKDESRGLFMCPITQDVLVNPVVASDGYTYSRPALKKWAKTNVSNGDIPRSPFTRQPLLMDDSTNSVIVAPNKPVRDIVQIHIINHNLVDFLPGAKSFSTGFEDRTTWILV